MKKKINKPSHLLFYVVNCDSKVQRFYDRKKVAHFIKKFIKKYPREETTTSGSWIDYVVFDVKGEIVFITDEYQVIE